MARETRWKLLAIGSTLLLLASLWIALFRPEIIDNQRWRSAMLQLDRSSVVDEQHRQLQALAAQAPDGRLMLVGDSQFQQFDTTRFSRPALNFGIGGDTVRHMVQRLPDYRYADRARAIILWGGVNDLFRGRDPQEVLADYEKLLAKIPKNKQIIVVGVAPLAPRGADQIRRNNDINHFNQSLAKICLANCEFIDLFTVLAGPDGGLAPAFDTGDGLHLNGEAHQWIARAIEQRLAAKKA